MLTVNFRESMDSRECRAVYQLQTLDVGMEEKWVFY